ncbi:hypothetical protein [Nocardiopsis sp. TNDT3]|uniref:hypothetical protein n=1 Tax=Nocardiopsis sp. TNDT3 TaxID=2249354 RepID=UPI000E3EBBEB|nr:hypothetical protein [Nocardiopsis sp. TNDT3]
MEATKKIRLQVPQNDPDEAVRSVRYLDGETVEIPEHQSTWTVNQGPFNIRFQYSGERLNYRDPEDPETFMSVDVYRPMGWTHRQR